MAALACSGCASAVTGLPNNVTGSSATVNGTVGTSSGGPVEFWVEYGPTTAYGSESPHQTTNVSAGETAYAPVRFDGLQLDTAYHYRLCARDSQQGSGGPGCGVDRTLRTQSVNCGDTITHDVRLTGPLICVAAGRVGFTIGAPGLDINLAGHPLVGLQTAVGFGNDGHDDVTIRNGSMPGWDTAIAIANASRNSIRDVDATGSTFAVSGGTGNRIRHSKGRFLIGSDGLVLADSRALPEARSAAAIAVDSSNGRFVHNVVQGIPFAAGIVVNGDGNRILENELAAATEGCIAIESGAGNVVRENTVHDCPLGVPTEMPFHGDGIFVAAAATDTLLRANTAFLNGDDGIDVRSASTRLLSNQADHNADFGIDAVAGVADLGGNSAEGNGNPLQCRNVFCG